MDRATTTADLLMEMRSTLRRLPKLPDDTIPRSMAEAYQVQGKVIERLLARSGGRPVGYKIAATNQSAQKMLKVDAPFFGILMSATTYASPVALPAPAFPIRCVEAEFGFEVAEDFPERGGGHTAESVKEHIGAVMPSMELVEHRFHDWSAVGAPSLIADNAIHGGWVFGEPRRNWRDFDYSIHAMTMSANGKEVATGTGAAVLGNPLNVMAWLANELERHGRRLRKGDKITTGTVANVYQAKPGDRVVADFGAIGRAEVTFTP